jgi:hypothetical protein
MATSLLDKFFNDNPSPTLDLGGYVPKTANFIPDASVSTPVNNTFNKGTYGTTLATSPSFPAFSGVDDATAASRIPSPRHNP